MPGSLAVTVRYLVYGIAYERSRGDIAGIRMSLLVFSDYIPVLADIPRGLCYIASAYYQFSNDASLLSEYNPALADIPTKP